MRSVTKWGLWAAFGAASACGCMALGVTIGDAMRDDAAVPVPDDSNPLSQAADLRFVEPARSVPVAPPPAPADTPPSFDPWNSVPVQAPESMRVSDWDLDAALPPPDYDRLRLDELWPSAVSVAVLQAPTREELDALPPLLGVVPVAHDELDEAFPSVNR